MEKLKRREIQFPILSFLLPLSCMMAVYVVMHISPFGGKCAMIIDSYHQYVPFFSEFHYKIRHLQSLLYSWHGSLGYNFWSVQAYYLASPLNFIIAIFPQSLMIEAFQTLIVLKISLSGLSAYIYLRHRKGEDSMHAIAFSAFYALGGFILAYNWNVMWLDCIYMFPIIVLGAEKLIKDGDIRLYTISFGLAILSNYYMAIMICVFLVLYFFVFWFSAFPVFKKKKSPVEVEEEESAEDEEEGESPLCEEVEHIDEICRDESGEEESGIRPSFIKRGFKYLIASLLALGIAAVYLLPTVFTMANSSTGSSPTRWEFYRSFFDMFAQHFAMTEPTQLTGPPNVYCGVGILLLAILSVAAVKVPLRERILKLALAAFIFISLNVNVLNYIWHGLHFPNNLPGRFSFIYIFLLVVMAFDAFCSLKEMKGSAQTVLSAAALILNVLVLIFAKQKISLEAKIVTGLLLALYIILLFVFRRQNSSLSSKSSYLIAALLVVELFANSIYAMSSNGSVTRSTYMSKTSQMAQIRDEYSPGKDTFYRMESAQILGRDDIVRYNMNGLSFFSSTCDDRMEKLMGSLGFYNAGNKYSYKGATPLTDAMMGIKYIISENELPDANLKQVDETKDLIVYENTQTLPVGYMVGDDFREVNIIDGEPFLIQNDIAEFAGDVSDNLFDRMTVPEPEIKEGEITSTEDDRWSYSSNKKGGNLSFDLSFSGEKDVYIYFEATHCSSLKVKKNDEKEEKFSDERGHIVHLGSCGEDDSVRLEFPFDDEYSSGKVVLQVFSFNREVFDEFYDNVSSHVLNVSRSDSTHIEGDIDAGDGGLMLLSIPYDEGWRIKVDGKVTGRFEMAEALIGLELSEGQHHIEMNYMPKGFRLGLFITIYSLVMLFILGDFRLPGTKK